MHNPTIVDLGFGDAGKGTMVDYLATGDSVVVRYCGGPQAAHNVIRDGRHHTFAQFGSGTFVGARTHLSRTMLVNPLDMMTEERHLDYLGVHDAFQRTTVDPSAVIVTPYHVALNRIMETSRWKNRHGSCGQGIGTTRADQLARNDMLAARDVDSPEVMGYVLNATRLRMLAEAEQYYIMCSGIEHADAEWAVLKDETTVERLIERYGHWGRLVERRDDRWLAEEDGNLIFEGAQGVLLDEVHGFAPHNTWTCTTPANAIEMCNWLAIETAVIGVVRTYMTRHGAGPLPTETYGDTAYMRRISEETHNTTGRYQGAWRVGHLDLPLLRYAIDCCSQVDCLAVTHLDRVGDDGMWVCTGYRKDGHHVSQIDPNQIASYDTVNDFWQLAPEAFAKQVAEELGLPLAFTSAGPTAGDKVAHI